MSKIMIHAKFSAKMYQWSQTELLPCFFIDDLPIQNWCAKYTHVFEDCDDLAPAQSWLYDEELDKIAWQHITPVSIQYTYPVSSDDQFTTTTVPLLVCRDDCDFDCSVLLGRVLILLCTK